jgi:hypothetical protein
MYVLGIFMSGCCTSSRSACLSCFNVQIRCTALCTCSMPSLCADPETSGSGCGRKGASGKHVCVCAASHINHTTEDDTEAAKQVCCANCTEMLLCLPGLLLLWASASLSIVQHLISNERLHPSNRTNRQLCWIPTGQTTCVRCLLAASCCSCCRLHAFQPLAPILFQQKSGQYPACCSFPHSVFRNSCREGVYKCTWPAILHPSSSRNALCMKRAEASRLPLLRHPLCRTVAALLSRHLLRPYV